MEKENRRGEDQREEGVAGRGSGSPPRVAGGVPSAIARSPPGVVRDGEKREIRCHIGVWESREREERGGATARMRS